MKKNIIIDTDMGSDDYIACQVAILSNKFNIEAISLVHGNTSINNVKNNIVKTLDMIGYKDKIKLYIGNDKPFKYFGLNTDDNAHGSNGFSDVKYNIINGNFEKEKASDMLIRKATEKKGKISIVALGPLTNIAEAIKKDKNFVNNVKELIIMGGAEKFGNITPYAEFNFYKDPLAADMVFKAGFKKIVMIGFNITKHVTITSNIEKFLTSIDEPNGQFIYDISRATADLDREKTNVDGAIINDAINICYLINPRVLKLKRCNISIELSNMERLGESKVSYHKPHNCLIAKKVNSKKCKKIIFGSIFKNYKKQLKKYI